MASSNLAGEAETLLGLHHGDDILVLVNAWDVISARLVEEAGFPAVATTSAGVAASLGYPDGERIPVEEMLAAVKRISEAISVPVTADMESGYGLPADQLVERLLDAGAVGMNIEDSRHGEQESLAEAEAHGQLVAEIRAAAEAAGVHLVINARADVFLLADGPPEGRLDEAIRRGRLYRQAGADSVFVPAVEDEGVITALVQAIDAPLNVLVRAGSPPIHRLAELGVARASLGGGTTRAAYTVLKRLANEIRDEATASAINDPEIISHDAVNRLLE
jgi:2-methylisocitrate lyase-like PEP mutase family enzyme